MTAVNGSSRSAWRTSAALLCLALVAGREAAAEDLNLDALARNARPSVLLLVVTDSAGLEKAYGTAFVVTKDGRIITNRHVARGSKELFAKTRNSKRHRVLGVLADDPEHDLVLLQVNVSDLAPLPLGASRDIETGDPVATVGNPLGFEGMLAQGTVMSAQEFLGERGWILVSAPVNHGSSGSPVLNARGEVIGVIAMMQRAQRTIGLAIPVEAVRRLIASVPSNATPKPLASLDDRPENDIFADPDFRLAAAASFNNDLDVASQRIELVLNRFPRSPLAHVLHAHILHQQGKSADAVMASTRATELNPRYATAWCILGSVHNRQGRFDAAIAALHRATELKPDYSEAWENLGWAHMQKKQFGPAADAYQQASRLRPEDDKVWYNLGLAHARANRPDHAAWAFKVAANLQPKNADFWRELGTAYARQAQFAMAVDALEKATRLKPDDSTSWYNLGLAYAGLEQEDKARVALRELKKIDPSKAEELDARVK